MLKRKFGSRYDWKRILRRGYAEKYFETADFEGYVTLLQMHEVKEPLVKVYGGTPVCIVDEGYSWLQHFPANQRYSVTTVFDASDQIVQWYIDICKVNGYCETNGPWMDDLFLDLIYLPSGRLIEKDADELEAAHSERIITSEEYSQAWDDFNKLKQAILKNQLRLLELTKVHFQELALTCNRKIE
ncbi:DUF402 domain-containing protein [Sporosarcina sp. Te-1]|uniref:DUF402 domain-containing protein n=1 Tax=Sporosarcina sp. Te-1 TaxID=2818390 RepID=UPI001A9DEB80|nr:DUF402 domain-containing protein [Sporosarcina sp. Te-1]QTD42570.1 DUF402 domain-containing protein [Sporosarcina sp. Te-1]